jgi:hypothetical protein
MLIFKGCLTCAATPAARADQDARNADAQQDGTCWLGDRSPFHGVTDISTVNTQLSPHGVTLSFVKKLRAPISDLKPAVFALCPAVIRSRQDTHLMSDVYEIHFKTGIKRRVDGTLCHVRISDWRSIGKSL